MSDTSGDEGTGPPAVEDTPAPPAPAPVAAPPGEPLLGNVPDDAPGDPAEIGHEEPDGLSD